MNQPSHPRFNIRHRIGEGALGVVYEAEDRDLGIPVALKTLRHVAPESIYGLKREFRNMADLGHPNLVRLYELFSHDGQWFFTMELLAGTDLLASVGPMVDAPDRAAWTQRVTHLLAQLVAGIAEAHRWERVHRDIKPSNIIVQPDDRLVVVDMGLSAQLEQGLLKETFDRGIAGTPAYIAPEQLNGEGASPASDWFAVGTIIYELLTAQLPFTGTIAEVTADKLRGPPLSPDHLVSQVPDRLASLCMNLMSRDPRDRPKPEAIMKALGADGGSLAHGTPAPASPMIERDQTTKDILGALDEVRREQAPGFVTVGGARGCGKSFFVEHAAKLLASRKVLTLRGISRERESVPFRGFDGIVDELSTYLMGLPAHEVAALMPRQVDSLVRLFPVLERVEAIGHAAQCQRGPADPAEVRQQAFAGFAEVFRRLSLRQPVVLFMDDAHCAGADEVALFESIIRQPHPPPMLVVALFASNSDSQLASGRLADRFSHAGLRVHHSLDLGRLSDEGIRTIVTQAAADSHPPTSTLDNIVRRAEGLPGVALSELQVWRTGSAGRMGSEFPTAGARPQDRIASLSSKAKNVVELLAVAGGRLRTSIIVAASDDSDLDADTCDELTSQGIAQPVRDGAAWALTPSVNAEQCASQLSAEGIASGHARLGRAYRSAEGEHYARSGAHLLAAGLGEEAAAAFESGGDRAMRALAFEQAAGFFRRALAHLAPRSSPRVGQLWSKLGETLRAQGRNSQAGDAFLQAAAESEQPRALGLRRLAAEAWLHAGHLDRGMEVMADVQNQLGLRHLRSRWSALTTLIWRRILLTMRRLFAVQSPLPGTPVLAAVQEKIDVLWTLSTGQGIVDTIRGAAFHTLHLHLALDCGDEHRVARALASEAAFISVGGPRSMKRTARAMHRAKAAATLLADPRAKGYVHLAGGISSFMHGNRKVGLQHCDLAKEIFSEQCRDVAWELGSARLFGLWCLTYLGSWRELERRMERTLRDADERGDRYIASAARTGIPNLVWLTRDQPDTAEAHLDTARDVWGRTRHDTHHYWDFIGRCHVDIYRGAFATALERMQEEWPAIQQSFILQVQSVRVEGTFVRARIHLGIAQQNQGKVRAAHLRQAERHARTLRRQKCGWGQGLAALVDAGIAGLRGDITHAQQAFVRAEVYFVDANMDGFVAVVRWRRAELAPGDSGVPLARAAGAYFAREKIHTPERFVASYEPALVRPPEAPADSRQ